ncbi:MAG: G/U mismatch-specific DNA glycosylase [Actinomycetota bacterium]|nr:G/U mismatch-specific DNA glycosylase [Actinomycetota bacterium]
MFVCGGVALAAPARPTKQEVLAAHGRTIPDVIGPELDVLFCGINPGLYSGATGHHFARPGNRFWPALHRSGFTPRLLSPFEEQELLPLGLGITNIVARTTAAAGELSRDELTRGAVALRRKVRRYSPSFLAVLGLQAYRIGFARRAAGVGEQDDRIGTTRVWLLPNPSGLNAHYQLAELAEEFARLRSAVTETDRIRTARRGRAPAT